MDKNDAPCNDIWAEWLLNRDGGSATYGDKLRRSLEQMRDLVLDGAQLQPDMTLLDVGTGDGLIAFGAIDRIGASLRVIAVDVSQPMLQHMRATAAQRGILSQCVFHTSSAEQMDELWDACVDVVATRASLAFVADKPRAIAEFFRVLKPGGRISICEPILQDKSLEAMALNRLIEANPLHPAIDRLQLFQRFVAAQYPTTDESILQNPLTNFTERDLVAIACDTGFTDVKLRLHIDVSPGLITDWDVFLNTSPHPGVPTSGELLRRHFSVDERTRFETYARPALESNSAMTKDAFAYLTAKRPCTTQ